MYLFFYYNLRIRKSLVICMLCLQKLYKNTRSSKKSSGGVYFIEKKNLFFAFRLKKNINSLALYTRTKL